MATPGISKRRMKEIRSLTRKKYRERRDEMLVEGTRNVKSAIAAGAPLREILITEEAHERAREFLPDTGTNVFLVTESEMEDLSTVETSQGILAVVGIERASPEALASVRRLVVLDGVGDPGNAGTLIRSAAWFGVEAVVTAPGTVDVYNPKVVRAAMGGLWDVVHVPVDDLAAELSVLRGRGFALYAADLHGREVDEWQPRDPSAIVFGSEAHGVSEGVSELIDEQIVIPGTPRRSGTESLNVAVAAGIVLYEWTKDRKGR